jgi:hypothetical protein
MSIAFSYIVQIANMYIQNQRRYIGFMHNNAKFMMAFSVDASLETKLQTPNNTESYALTDRNTLQLKHASKGMGSFMPIRGIAYNCSLSLWRVVQGSKLMHLDSLIHGLFIA